MCGRRPDVRPKPRRVGPWRRSRRQHRLGRFSAAESPRCCLVDDARRRTASLRTLLHMANPVHLIAETVRDRARRGELDAGAEEAVREELRRYAELTPLLLTEQEVRDLFERMLVTSGRRVD